MKYKYEYELVIKTYPEYCKTGIAICPKCGGNVAVSRYAQPDRIGFVYMKCQKCGLTTTISRVIFPDDIECEPF